MEFEKIKKEWNELWEKYATEINEMVSFIEKNWWEEWEKLGKKEAEDNREYLTKEVYKLLKEANENGNIDDFRKNFPPSREPFLETVEKNGKFIWDMHFIENEKIVFMTGSSYEGRNTYILDWEKIEKISDKIQNIGKSHKNNIFAVAYSEKIEIYEWFFGKKLREFERKITKWNIEKYEDWSENFIFSITKIIPFNDWEKVLLVSPEGFYIISENEEKNISPVFDEDDENYEFYADMENAYLSHDNEYIVIWCQDSDFIIFDKNWEKIGEIWPQGSSYPHFCIFSKNDKILAMNSCHFYNWATCIVEEKNFTEKIDAWDDENKNYKIIDEEMRIYEWISTEKYFIFGDAYGYIRAVDENGNHIWRHYLGSTISGIAISDDEKTLWVWSYSGILHKLKLFEWQDSHTIWNWNHKEVRRFIFWNEENILKW